MGVYEEHGGDKSRNKNKKKSGQIPAFGNWDYANDLPITQYFESARQAGLIRFGNVSSAANSDSRDCPIYAHSQAQGHHLYALHFHHRRNNFRPPPPKTKKLYVSQANEYERQTLKKEKKINKIDYYLTEPPKHQSRIANKNSRGSATRVPSGKQNNNIKNVKAVDEDLYKISPQLLHSSKRKKKLGLFSRCLVPDCMV